MKSSKTSSWELANTKKLGCKQVMAREALLTSSTRELVEFYWTNRNIL